MASTEAAAAAPPEADVAEEFVVKASPKHHRKGATEHQRLQDPPYDFSFKEISTLEEVLTEEPNGKKRPSKERCTGLLLGNNSITTLTSLPKVLPELLQDPVEQLQWLDASHNQLDKVEQVIMEYPNISVLYLHGNNIQTLKEVNKLAQLPNLKRLSLHGNPVEERARKEPRKKGEGGENRTLKARWELG
ncbi:hypothetical protein CYMTET_25092 [Cymbomonas tetramitiformis]|uniref:Leucine-rich repeat-containing protein 51 n=1 Tax=Cymbomonas tetramitiformis TaxID=36881 RepID=A0AAE0KZI9_9CHLO|nr:hypothetical protein CYMTET_25092 [Cymbomonas tetramitiformis]